MQWNNPISPTAYKKLGKKEYGRNPVGAGPFRFVEWKSGTHVILERNPDYWKKDASGKQLPYLDRIQYRLIIDDSVRLLELKSGNAHFMELVQGKDIASVKADSNLVFLESASSGNNYRLIFDSENSDSPFAKSKKLRQAVLTAIDREAMVKTLGFGSGYGRQYLLPKGSFAYDESVPYYWYDKAKAQQLFKEALAETQGLAGADGKVAATLSVIDRAVDKMQAEMIKQMLDSVGFNIKIEIVERAAWTAKLVRTPGQPGGKHDFATMRNPVVPDDPDGQWRTFFHSKGGFNVAHLNNPAWDNPIDTAAASYNTEERKKIYKQLAQMAYDDPWYGWLWQQNWNWLHSAKLKGFSEVVTNRWMFTEAWLA
jgi:ABC-type transport system substrate-binding protein